MMRRLESSAARDPAAPTPREFRRAIRDGEIRPSAPGTKHMLGKICLTSFLTGEPPPGLDGRAQNRSPFPFSPCRDVAFA
jgi:hypothetical protein